MVERLNKHNLPYFMLHPTSNKLTKEDHKKALFLTIFYGAISFGTVQLICLCLKNRVKFTQPNSASQTQKIVSPSDNPTHRNWQSARSSAAQKNMIGLRTNLNKNLSTSDLSDSSSNTASPVNAASQPAVPSTDTTLSVSSSKTAPPVNATLQPAVPPTDPSQNNPNSSLVVNDSKFYFIKNDCKGYTLQELLDIALSDCQKIIEKLLSKKKTYCFVDLNSPQGQWYATYFLESPKKKIDVIATEIIQNIKESTLVDWARSSNQTTCPFSLDDYHKPYLLTLNGRTYSKKYITEAVERSLYKDEHLRLEDITLKPSMIDRITLVPNLSLCGKTSQWKKTPETIKFSAKKIQFKHFNEREARNKNINEFSDFIRMHSPGQMKVEALYDYYATARQLPCYEENRTEFIEDLVFQNITFPPVAPKSGLTFRNVLFEKCEIVMECWCNFTVRSSKFVDCTIRLSDKFNGHGKLLKRTKFVNCTIIMKEDQTTQKGTYKNMAQIPSILDHIYHVVENASDLENCTLKIV